ncbi:MAG: ABC transporter permease subunit [Promethearchaeota archaeon]
MARFRRNTPTDYLTKFMSTSQRKELKHTFTLFKQSPMFIFGSILIFIIVILSFFTPALHIVGIVPFEQDDFNFPQKLLPPLTPDNRTYIFWEESVISTPQLPQGNIRVTSGLVNGDNLVDLIFGDDNGNIFITQNEGNENVASFKSSENVVINNIADSPMRVDGSAQPCLADLNGDNLLDLVVGTENGSVYYSQNTGDTNLPVWSPLLPLSSDGNPIKVETKASPALYDLDQDNDLDLVIGSGQGSLDFYKNTGDVNQWNWELIPTPEFSFSTGYLKENGFTSAIYLTITRIAKAANYETLVIVTTIEGIENLLFFGATSRSLDTKAYIEISSAGKVVLPTEEYTPGIQAVTLFDIDNNTYIDLLYFNNNGELYQLLQLFTVDGRIHLFGLDENGGDVFSRCLWALQLDLVMSLWIVALAVFIGVCIGCLAGYFAAFVDTIIMRITDVFYAFPGIILAMAIASVLGRNMFNLGIALIAVWWTGYTRLIRAQVLLEKEKAYVESARAQGFSNLRILFKHVLPNSWYPILVAATLDLGSVILSLAGLSFIGFGAPIGSAELGRMISDGRQYFPAHAGLTFFPGLFIFISVMGWNLVGDGLRDVLDPRLRR